MYTVLDYCVARPFSLVPDSWCLGCACSKDTWCKLEVCTTQTKTCSQILEENPQWPEAK
jgi:hypothetical protein